MTNNDKWIDEFHEKELLDRPKWCWINLNHRTCLSGCNETTCPLNPDYHKEQSATIH